MSQRNSGTCGRRRYKVIERCEKATEKMYFTEALVPALDGTMPTRDTATAAANKSLAFPV